MYLAAFRATPRIRESIARCEDDKVMQIPIEDISSRPLTQTLSPKKRSSETDFPAESDTWFYMNPVIFNRRRN